MKTLYDFTFHFIGRERNAIGIFYPITATTTAEQEDDARLKLYDKYEHIRVLSVEKKGHV